MQQTDRVAVLATHLAQTDRRALSQAWYSALHFAGATRPLSAPRYSTTSAGRLPAVTLPSRVMQSAFAASDFVPNPSARPRVASSQRAGEPSAPERRSPKSALARRIERGVQAQGKRPGMGSFAVRDERARVHVVVRTIGAATRVVAVCEPALRERVERALAQARFALAGRAVRVEAVR
jgi:hypothetical protein